MSKNRFSKLFLGLAGCILLAGCNAHTPANGEETRASKIDSALERAAMSAAASGNSGQSLTYLEKIYKRKSSDPESAIIYAKALREADYLNRAQLVLAPFADDESSPAFAKTEYAAIQLAQGDYKEAEKYAQKAVLQNEEGYQAYHYLGVALDAQSMHKEAERAFRKGLDYWKGDPIPIMNNLALNLTSQGYLDEAVEILEKAQAVAPDRLEVERNLRIVRALQHSDGRRAPKPLKKPDYQE